MWNSPANVTEDTSLHNRAHVFGSRAAAGHVMAGLLADLAGTDTLLLAIPAGGVPIATTMATRLGLPLSVLVVSKITLPWNTEAGYGAVAADGSHQINEPLAHHYRLDPETIQEGIDKTTAKVNHRQKLFTELLGQSRIDGRTVILVDDGLASGFTLRVAIASARNQGARRILVAVPTGHASSVSDIAALCDHVYCANVREGMRYAVAEAYERWSDVGEEEMLATLREYMNKDCNQ